MLNNDCGKVKVVTEKDLVSFRNHTNGMIALIVLFTIACPPLCFLILWLYIRERDAKQKVLLAEYQASFDLRQLEIVSQHVDYVVDYNQKQIVADSNYYLAGVPFLCRTCQQNYKSISHEDITLCWNLRNVFPHDPHAAPPSPNPYQWYWFQVNGYPMPPANWPKTKYWMPQSAGQADAAGAMKEEGQRYYMTHPNHLWDRGLGNPPEWYFRKEIQAA